MNLSPQYQQQLLVALRRLMDDPAVALRQLFISTHSPYFEFVENFYHVTLDERGNTQVTPATVQDHVRHFAVTPLGPDTGSRLNSLNQVELYPRMIEDLGLRWGDLVFFVKNEAGRWEVRLEGEILEELEAVWRDNGQE